jgi:hypothetical protein
MAYHLARQNVEDIPAYGALLETGKLGQTPINSGRYIKPIKQVPNSELVGCLTQNLPADSLGKVGFTDVSGGLRRSFLDDQVRW